MILGTFWLACLSGPTFGNWWIWDLLKTGIHFFKKHFTNTALISTNKHFKSYIGIIMLINSGCRCILEWNLMLFPEPFYCSGSLEPKTLWSQSSSGILWHCSWRLIFWHSPIFWHHRLLATEYLIYWSQLDHLVEAYGRELAKRQVGHLTACPFHHTMQDKLVPSSMPPLRCLYIRHRGWRYQWSAKKFVTKEINMAVWFLMEQQRKRNDQCRDSKLICPQILPPVKQLFSKILPV